MSELPIVTFGKYKDKPVTELLADDDYVKWLKQQSWFTNQKPIYNIVVNQQINQSNLNSKTPEHNSLQNKFLDDNSRIKLITKINNGINISYDSYFNGLLNNVDFIKNFGTYTINDCQHNYVSKYEFEGKFNWDLIINRIYIIFTFNCNEEYELSEKKRYTKMYDLESYKIYRLRTLNTLFNKYDNQGVCNIDLKYYDDKLIATIRCTNYIDSIYCEIKPTISDDYPNVLRKMKTQITLIDKNMHIHTYKYILIVKNFISNTVSKDQFIKIFNNSHIHVIFTDEIFDEEINNNILTINNSDSKLVDDLKSELEKQKLLINELKIENEKLKKDIQKLKKK